MAYRATRSSTSYQVEAMIFLLSIWGANLLSASMEGWQSWRDDSVLRLAEAGQSWRSRTACGWESSGHPVAVAGLLPASATPDYDLCLRSSDRNTAGLMASGRGAAYRRRGVVPFDAIDDPRFGHADEFRCVDLRARRLFVRCTHVLCCKCGASLGFGYDDRDQEGGRPPRYDIKIRVLQPLAARPCSHRQAHHQQEASNAPNYGRRLPCSMIAFVSTTQFFCSSSFTAEVETKVFARVVGEPLVADFDGLFSGHDEPAIVVGAGPVGLSVAACLRAQGVPCVVLDRADCIASLWQRRTYDCLRVRLPRHFCELPGMPFPDHYPEYSTEHQFVDYLNAYTEQAGVQPRFNQGVTSVCYDHAAGLWRVLRVRNSSVVNLCR